MEEWKEYKIIDGKKYEYHNSHKYKDDAKRIAANIRKFRGLNVRIVYSKNQTYPYALYSRSSIKRKVKPMKRGASTKVYSHGAWM